MPLVLLIIANFESFEGQNNLVFKNRLEWLEQKKGSSDLEILKIILRLVYDGIAPIVTIRTVSRQPIIERQDKIEKQIQNFRYIFEPRTTAYKIQVS